MTPDRPTGLCNCPNCATHNCPNADDTPSGSNIRPAELRALAADKALDIGTAWNALEAAADRIEALERERRILSTAIETAIARFDDITWGWDGNCGAGNIMNDLEGALTAVRTSNPSHHDKESEMSEMCKERVLLGWIAVTDRLPQGKRMCISEEVLVTVSNLPDDFHVVRVDRYDAHSGSWDHCNPESDRATITAWMPMPQPYAPNPTGQPPPRFGGGSVAPGCSEEIQ